MNKTRLFFRSIFFKIKYSKIYPFLKELEGIKIILGILFIFTGYAFSKDNPTLLGVFIGTGITLIISSIFELFEIKRIENAKRRDFIDEFLRDINLSDRNSNSKTLKKKVLDKFDLINSQFRPNYLKASGTLEKLDLFNDLIGYFGFSKRNKFMIKPFLESIIFVGNGSLSGRIIENESIYRAIYISDKYVSNLIERLFWSFHGEYGLHTKEFINYLNKNVVKRLKWIPRYNRDIKSFIEMYFYIAKRSIYSPNSYHKGFTHFDNHVYYGFYEGRDLAINGMKLIEKSFPNTKRLINIRIKQIYLMCNNIESKKKEFIIL